MPDDPLMEADSLLVKRPWRVWKGSSGPLGYSAAGARPQHRSAVFGDNGRRFSCPAWGNLKRTLRSRTQHSKGYRV